MASDLAAKAKAAFIDDHFELAADLYSQAISIEPNNPEFFSDRAQANNKLHNFTEAVADANKAMELDSSNPKAYLRKGLACFSLEEYQTAKTAFEAGSALAPEDSRFTDWLNKCDKCIADENAQLPTQLPDATLTNGVALNAQAPENVNATTEDAEQVKNSEMIITPAKPKYRHEYYQKPDEVVVTIFAKGIPANSVSINYGEQILSVTIDVPGEDSYIFQPRLFGKIVPTKCRYDVLSTKIEIRLTKAESIHWTSLEYGNNSLVAQPINVSTGMATRRFVPQHNYRVNLSSMQPGTDYYHPVFDFLRRSRVNYVLTDSPILYLTYIEQFWDTAAYDSNVTPPVIRARVANVDFEFSAADLREILQLGTVEQEAGPTTFSQALRSGAFRRMGYVGDTTKNTYFKRDLYGYWRYFAHVMVVALSNKKTGFDSLNIETQSQVIALTYNKPYSFSQFFFNEMRDQIGAGDRERFLMYPRFVMMIINTRILNLPELGHIVEVAGLDKRVYKDFTSYRANKLVECRAKAVPLFGALVNPAYQAPPNDGWEDVAPGNQPEGATGELPVAQAGAEAAQAQPQPEVQPQPQVVQEPEAAEQAQDQQVPPEAINDALDDIGVREDFGPNEGQMDDDEAVEAFDATRDEAAVDQGEENREDKGKTIDTAASEESEESDSESDDGPDYDAIHAKFTRVGSKTVLEYPSESSSQGKKRKECDDEDYVPKDDVPLRSHRKRTRRATGEACTSSRAGTSDTTATTSTPLTTEPQNVPPSVPVSSPQSSPVVPPFAVPENMRMVDLENKVNVLTARLVSCEALLETQLVKHNAKMAAMQANYDARLETMSQHVAQLTQRLNEQQ